MIFSPVLRSLILYFSPGRAVSSVQTQAPCSIPVSQAGIWYCKMGNNECWEAIGPIQERFRQISIEIKRCLRECGPPEDAIVTWSLYMVGRTRDTAVPTILICSSKKRVRKMVRVLVEENRVLDQWTSLGFNIGDCSIAPDHYRMPSSNDTVRRLSSDEYSIGGTSTTSVITGTPVWCRSTAIEPGMKIFFKPTSDSDETQFATIGSIFSANGKYYATTVGHLFTNELEPEQETDETVEFEFDIGGDWESDTGSDFVVNIEDSTETCVTDGPGSHDFGFVHDPEEDSPESRALLGASSLNLVRMGRLVFVDTSSGLDYTIIEIDTSHISCTDHWKKKILPGITMAQTAYQAPKIAAVVAKTSSGGPIEGRLSETPSFIRFPHGPEFREVWTVRFDQSLSKGDCGSMVVDPITHQLCGHIVAGSPLSGVAYIIPAYEVFEDIKKVLEGLQKAPINDKSTFPHSRGSSTLNRLFDKEENADHGSRISNKQNTPSSPSSFGVRRLLSSQEIAKRKDLLDSCSTDDERQRVLDSIDSGGIPWRVIIVAAAGFFTDSYSIFATNAILPLLTFVYSANNTSLPNNLTLNDAALFGATIGQLFFGITADIWGRRRLYGLELILVIVGVLGMIQASGTGMTLFSWLFFWRLVMGIGIGGGYPLSAVITAEFAPSRYRARMMTAISLAQPLGQLSVGLVSTFVARQALKLGDLGIKNQTCDDRCMVDYLWRVVIGVGALPALVAIVFRLGIPESPRYTLDVMDDTNGAAAAVAKYYGKPAEKPGLKTNPCTWQQSQPGGLTTHGHKLSTAKSTSPLVDFYKFIWADGNWRYLAGTSVCWLLFDFAFYGLGLNHPQMTGTIWISNEPEINDIPQWLSIQPNHTELPAVSFLRQQASSRIDIPIVGTLVGCFLVYFSVTHLARRKLQLFGFLGLFAVLLFLGVQLSHFSEGSQSPLVIFLFCLCQVFFNFGPNTTTFMLPAELFPTRYRGTAYGISAAIGKIGSIVAQHILRGIMTSTVSPTSLVPNGTSRAFLLVSAFMLIGAFVTWQWVPEPQWSDRPGAVLGKWKSTVLSRWIGMKSRKEATAGTCASVNLTTEMEEVLWNDWPSQ